jgi:hypothetical protein
MPTIANLRHMVWLKKSEMSAILDALDHYAKTHSQTEIMGDVRERIVLARYGKVLKTEIPAIRTGSRRVPTNADA